MKMLSPRQKSIIEFVKRFSRERNYPPTVRDIVDGCGISSTSVAAYNLDILQEQGYIRRHRGISRGIELVNQSSRAKESTGVPLVGLIAAGAPIPVPAPDVWDVAAGAETIDVSPDLTRGRENIYALRVKGTSMIDALINDGDIVLMQPTSVVENGQMAAVWLKNEKEVTLKKLYRERDRIRLQPANSQMKPIYVEPDNVEVQGKVVGVLRLLD